MVRSGKLPAHIENIERWGPTWIVNDTDVLRILNPDQPLVEILPSDYETPMQMLKDVREGMITLTDLIKEGDRGIRDELHTQKRTWQAEMETLRQEVEQLRSELQQRQRRSWWPWKR